VSVESVVLLAVRRQARAQRVLMVMVVLVA
jgi:hypothetical protein